VGGFSCKFVNRSADLDSEFRRGSEQALNEFAAQKKAQWSGAFCATMRGSSHLRLGQGRLGRYEKGKSESEWVMQELSKVALGLQEG